MSGALKPEPACAKDLPSSDTRPWKEPFTDLSFMVILLMSIIPPSRTAAPSSFSNGRDAIPKASRGKGQCAVDQGEFNPAFPLRRPSASPAISTKPDSLPVSRLPNLSRPHSSAFIFFEREPPGCRTPRR